MPGMPYVLEKSPLFTVIEDYVSLRTRRLTLLRNFRDLRVPFWDTGVLNQPELLAALQVMYPTLDPPVDPAAHVRDHWLGLEHGTYNTQNGHWLQPSTGNPPTTPTGWWTNWNGPAEAILRESLLRTLEVSLGLTHCPSNTNGATDTGSVEIPTPSPTVPTVPENRRDIVRPHTTPDPVDVALVNRMWPVEILWVCGSPSLQGFVTWRNHGLGETEGQVTLVLTTPAINGSAMYSDPENDPNLFPPTDPFAPPWEHGDYSPNPGNDLRDITAQRGVWLVSAAHSSVIPICTSTSVDIGSDWDDLDPDKTFGWILPRSLHWSSDDPDQVIVIRPSQKDGGVLGTPTQF
jgi:hypothetical protein